jgi:hypothetical protein
MQILRRILRDRRETVRLIFDGAMLLVGFAGFALAIAFLIDLFWR